MKSLNSLQPVGLLVLRLALGLIFLSHGYPKLAHSGAGMQDFFVQHGLPGYFVYIAGVLEVFGGTLLVLGLFTRGAALLLAIEMGVPSGRSTALAAIWPCTITNSLSPCWSGVSRSPPSGQVKYLSTIRYSRAEASNGFQDNRSSPK